MARKKPAGNSNAENPRDRASVARRTVEGLKHKVHGFQAGIRTLEEKAAVLRNQGDAKAADLVGRQAALLRDELSELEAEITRLPEVADALGLVAAPDLEPPEVIEVVKAAEFETFNIKVKEESSLGSPPVNPEWPRTGQVIQDNEIVTVETVGKVRVQMNDKTGGPAGAMPFQITAIDTASGETMVLRRGRTNSHGYASINLVNMPAASLDDLKITVGTGGGDGQDEQVLGIDGAALAVHRDLGIPHHVVVRPEIIDKLRPRFPDGDGPEKPGTIEDPDDSDIKNSPESFGLNPEKVDDNCCLRPRAEFAAREYHFRQIVRIDDPDLVLRKKPFKRVDVRAPISFGGESPGQYSVKGGNLLLGTVNMYRQGWYPVGRGLGELLYSLALAPCEHVNLAFIDWSREERDTRTDVRVASERMEHDLNHDRSISEVVNSVLTEKQSGRSSSGGGGASLDLGFFSIGGGGGSTSSSTSGRRSLQASTLQDISDEVSQRASAIRSQRSTVVTTSSQRESERIQTRTVHNHNRNHAMTVQYFQVLSHYSIKTELVEEKPVLLVPYEIDPDLFDDIPSFDKFVLAPSRPITRFLDRHSRLIRRLVSRKYRRAFESLSRLLHCRDVYDIEQPFATFSRWKVRLDKAWRPGISLSIETDSGQSVPLRPRGGSGDRNPVEFISDPVKHNDIKNIRISFDPVEAVRMTSASGLLGGKISSLGDFLEEVANHKIENVEISVRTDRSRFVREPQSFRLAVGAVNTTLSSSNPSVTISVSEPSVSFEGYRGREHEDYCKLKTLIAYIQSQPMRFMRAIWYYEDPDRRALRFDRYTFQGNSLLDSIVNRPVGVLGNYVAFELLEGHRLVKLDAPKYMVSSRIVSMPTRGVFAEVFLSCCNATEKRDVERFIDPDQSCQVRAPDITGVTPGTRASRSDTTPTGFPTPIVAMQNAPGVPDPGGLGAALGVLGTPDIFRDLSRGAELLQFVNNATKEAFTSTRQHRAAMDAIAGDVVRGIVSAYTGVPISGSGGKSSGAAASGTTGIKSSPSGGGKKGAAAGTPGSSSAAANPALQALSSELFRQTSPARVSDHVQTISRAVDSGLLSDSQGNQLTNALLGGSGLSDETAPLIILTAPVSRDGLTFGAMAGDKSGSLVLTASVTDAPEGHTTRWTRPNPASIDLTDQAAATVTATPLIPGRQELDFAVKDSSSTQLASIKIPLSVPQFVAVREEAASFDAVLTAFQVDDVKEPLLQTAKEVCDLLLNTANVRTIWEMAPFNEALPAQFQVGGAGAANVTVATLRGDPPSSGLAGRTHAGTGGIGPAVFDETISVWPGAFDDPVAVGAAGVVDDATRQVVQAMQGLDYTDLIIKNLAIQVFGRLIGESLAHEIIHSLLGFLIPTGHHSPAVADDIMNRGSDRSFQSRTAIEITSLPAFPGDGSFVDHGIGFINIPTGATQTLIDLHFPASI